MGHIFLEQFDAFGQWIWYAKCSYSFREQKKMPLFQHKQIHKFSGAFLWNWHTHCAHKCRSRSILHIAFMLRKQSHRKESRWTKITKYDTQSSSIASNSIDTPGHTTATLQRKSVSFSFQIITFAIHDVLYTPNPNTKLNYLPTPAHTNNTVSRYERCLHAWGPRKIQNDM